MRRPLPLLLAVILVPPVASAQVGHDPARSPYRELIFGQFVGFTGGWFGGSGGKLGIVPHGGPTIGFRYDFLGASTVGLSLSAAYADLERFTVRPNEPQASQLSGPVKQSVASVEAIVQFNLTGNKTWKRLAPFVTGAGGLVLASRDPADTVGWSFRSKGTITPGVGTRVFLSQRAFLRLEARVTFWHTTYPLSWTTTAPGNAPNEPPILFGQSRKEWISNPYFSAGLSYAFFRPF